MCCGPGVYMVTTRDGESTPACQHHVNELREWRRYDPSVPGYTIEHLSDWTYRMEKERLNGREGMLEYKHDPDTPADNILENVRAHKAAIDTLEKLLPIACEKEGHKWDNPAGVHKTICVREGLWIEHDLDPDRSWGRSNGHWAIEPDRQEVYQRTCTRCGKVENKKPITTVTSPFVCSNSPAPKTSTTT